MTKKLNLRDFRKEIHDIMAPVNPWEEYNFHGHKGKYYLNTRFFSGLQLAAVQKNFDIIMMEGQDDTYGNICIELRRKTN